ncbi:hypothetical protein TTHERM_000113249 (macronuclear) [Tetrahymena thermophila SB210]|uniref:Uncharacterized protein n=1 Tax=Tetrahymena thermophila (strain SB210) TaxID=312017 RepID=W7XJQ0_TETTS|nr:hypothetical protein TTHERM_000113249 [Tetrahymena thermophila SB210]EWS75781.1 hypothetical protein TTHERM_000113249 [Tetrahymena thermophila SB210]|eukprot:XP_012651703.1 hypothetical protein TTHERM_000113249 [Tetrahymena thermophila SB210]
MQDDKTQEFTVIMRLQYLFNLKLSDIHQYQIAIIQVRITYALNLIKKPIQRNINLNIELNTIIF